MSINKQDAYTFTTKSGNEISVKDIQFSEISEQLWTEYFDIRNQIFREMYPETDPLPNNEAIKHQKLNPHPHYEVHNWFAFHNHKIVGYANLSYTNSQSPSFELNEHISNAIIVIHQSYRRQGIATELLNIIVNKAIQENKKILQTDIYLDNGVEFCTNLLQAKPAKTGNENRLYFNQVDWGLMELWIKEGKERAKGVEIKIYSKIPENIIEEFCKVYNITSSQEPSDQLEEYYVETPESRRIMEKQLDNKNQILMTAVSQEQNGKISGLTEIFFDPQEDYKGSQWLTGVKEEFRGRGIGKWIKAEMLIYLKDNYPSIKFVRAGNADLNAPMRSINDRMGFKTIFKRYDYNLHLKDLADALNLQS